ncbi:MAG: nuclear transport factor 2 family protein [Algibacter sp.]|uniref:nuclear transport factor 2 family protein n=1 Tax=Algibacter sp. TaxID=1872428 RepID=UPI00329A6ECC
MKKLFLLGFATIFFVACQEKHQQRYFENSAEIETLKAGIKAYETQDWAMWKANFADSAKIYHNTNKPSSPDETMTGMKQMLSNFSEYKFLNNDAEIEMIIDKDGDTWVNYWNSWGGKAKVTGKKISVPVHLTVQFIDGKIVNEYAYYDTASIGATIAEIKAAQENEVE